VASAGGQQDVTKQSLLSSLGIRMPHLQTFDSLSESTPFRWLLIGNFLSQSAHWLQLLTIGWLIRDLTAGTVMSAFLVVVAGGLSYMPGLITGPFGGAIGDRFDRRKLVISVQVFMAIFSLCFAFFVGARLVGVVHCYIYVFIAGVCLSITMPARQAMVPDSVPDRLLGNAIATNVITFPATRMIGPFIGGILISTLGFFWNFALESLMYTTSIIAFLFLSLPSRSSRKEGVKWSILADLSDGFKYMWSGNRVLLYLAICALIPNTILEPAIFLLPVFTQEVLRRGPDVGGYLMAVNGMGGMFMILVISSFGFIFPKGKLLLWSAVFSSIAILLFSYAYIMFLAFFFIFAFAWGQSCFRATNITLLQSLCVPEMRGRITSLQTYSFAFVMVASIVFGWFAGITTVSIALATIGIIGLILSILANMFQDRIKQLA